MAWNTAVGGMSVAEAPASERVAFLRKTYLHLGGAVLAFIAVEAALLNSPLARAARADDARRAHELAARPGRLHGRGVDR